MSDIFKKVARKLPPHDIIKLDIKSDNYFKKKRAEYRRLDSNLVMQHLGESILSKQLSESHISETTNSTSIDKKNEHNISSDCLPNSTVCEESE